MFDRVFFEHDFLKGVRAFAQEQKGQSPVVEFLLDDGSLVYVKQIHQTKEQWFLVTLHDDGDTKLVFCPYYCVKRISFYKTPPKTAKVKDLGFQIG